MNIKISRLELTNFKCFSHREFTFDSDVTTVRGRNGVGKTTIADAILWCLFGKNTQGQSDFDLKTHDADGKPIPNLDHSVEISFEVGYPKDGCHSIANCITLKRTLRETWVKKRGSDEQVFKNNTTEYMVNGNTMTAADYKKYISDMVSESLFRTITNPQYFPSLKWQEQRTFLTQMVGSIEPEVIANSDELVALVHQLDDSNDDIISYRKHLSYQIKQIKDKLDKIPVRLEEQNKALPERLDWDALQVQYTAVEQQSQEVSEKIIAIKSGNGGDVLREQIREEMKFVQRKLDSFEVAIRTNVRQLQTAKDERINALSRQFNQLVSTQRDLEASIPSFDKLAKQCRDNASEIFKKEQEYIRSEWPKTQVSFDSYGEDARCALCGQLLPTEQIDAAREKFNTRRAELRKELNERAAAAKQLLVDAETEAKKYETEKAEAEKRLADIKEQINTIFAEKAKAEKEEIKTFDDCLADNTEYQNCLKEKAELQSKLDSVGISDDDASRLADLEAQKVQYTTALQQLNTQLASKEQYSRIMALIDGINEEQKSLVSQLSDLERREDIARQYQDRQNAILEERVNEHFKIVRWRMFRTVNNGGEPFQEPYCECYVDGVAYHDGLNQAARLNAGLDIINALCSHYSVSAPIVLDNAESTINILPTVGQQIRLQVADTDLQLL